MNPSVDSQCSNLLAGEDYCVAPVNGTTVPPVILTRQPTMAATSPTMASSTASSTVIAPPGPTVAGTTSQCYKWYQVVSGDTCDKIDTTYGITSAQFRSWNSAVDFSCSNIQVGVFYCVNGVTQTAPASSSTAMATVAPPGPTGTGTTTACWAWYTVISGDTCDRIDTTYGITLPQFQTWNGNIDAACTNLVVGNAYCVAGP